MASLLSDPVTIGALVIVGLLFGWPAISGPLKKFIEGLGNIAPTGGDDDDHEHATVLKYLDVILQCRKAKDEATAVELEKLLPKVSAACCVEDIR